MKPSGREIFVFKTEAQINDFIAERWERIILKSTAKNGVCHIALSAGETPRALYRHLACKFGPEIWSQTHIFQADERFVPFDHPENNSRMLCESLFDHIKIPAENLHLINTSSTDLKKAAEEYECAISKTFCLKEKEYPCLDICLLGVGMDGHTASVFPGAKMTKTPRKLVASAQPKGMEFRRITLTLDVINRSKYVFFLVQGEKKAKILKEMVGNKSRLPAALVKPSKGRCILVLDQNAARLLAL